MFWQRWASRLQSSGVWRRVIWYTGTNISDEHPASIFRVRDCVGQLYCETRGAHGSSKITSFWDGIPYSLVKRYQRSWGTFCFLLQGRKLLPSSHRISTWDTRFPGSVKITKKVAPCSVRTILPGEHVLPERWMLRTLPKLQFTPMFQNTLHHISEECNRHVFWRKRKQNIRDFQMKTWNL
jgi:hypothetical protein